MSDDGPSNRERNRRKRVGNRVAPLNAALTPGTVWVLGESDDWVEAVFTTRELAWAYAARHGIPLDEYGGSSWWLEEERLDPADRESESRS